MVPRDPRATIQRQVMILPCDDTWPRFEAMSFSVEGAEAHAFNRHTLAVDVHKTFGKYTRYFTRTRDFGLVDQADELCNGDYEITYNLCPKLPVNQCLARILGIDPKHPPTDRPFWRGDVVVVKQEPWSGGVKRRHIDYRDVLPGARDSILSGFFPHTYNSPGWKRDIDRQSLSEEMDEVDLEDPIMRILKDASEGSGASLRCEERAKRQQDAREKLLTFEEKRADKERQYASRSCRRCGKGSFPDISQCSGCKKVFYCSKECQKRDWKMHRPDCKA